jgi:hypothetical protein
MSKLKRHPKKSEAAKRIARQVKQRLIFLIVFLIAILLVLVLRIGEDVWPLWMYWNRTQIAGLLLLLTIIVIALSPLLIEASVKARVLSGPGKNPEGPRLG